MTRIRLEGIRRSVTVAKVHTLTPRMIRVHFASEQLRDFTSPSPDDHIKIFFPAISSAGTGKPVMRDFTPRHFDAAHRSLIVDFALHESGPASDWASSAKVGDTLEVGGPRGSSVLTDDFDWYLLIGDASALPSIGRRIEELRENVSVTTIILVDTADEIQTLETRATWTPVWIFRQRDTSGEIALGHALEMHTLQSGDGFIWMAGETTMIRQLYHYLVEERRHPKEWLKAAGYWTRGVADAHENIGH